MTRKTVRLYASNGLVGNTLASATASFAQALANLEAAGKREGREVLFDTLNVEIERSSVETSTIGGESTVEATFTTINVDAEAVLKNG